MAAVYSKQFCSSAGVTGGPFTVYTCPPGRLAVVKSMTIVWGDVVASGADAWFQTDDLTKLTRYAWGFTLATPTNFGGDQHRWGSWVLNPGQELQIQTAAGTMDFAASGYELALP